MSDGSNTNILVEKILSLREKRRSYNFIASELGIAKSTVSYWLANDSNSKLVKEYLTLRHREQSRRRMTKMSKQASKRWFQWRLAAQKEALVQFKKLIPGPLFVFGITAYWGEGDSKPENPLRISNTDPRMIKLYVLFLKKVLNVPNEKIRLAIILYPDLNEDGCKKFWSKTAELPQENFMKTQRIQGYHPTKRLAHGICMVIVNSRQLKEKVLVWIDLLSKTHTI